MKTWTHSEGWIWECTKLRSVNFCSERFSRLGVVVIDLARFLCTRENLPRVVAAVVAEWLRRLTRNQIPSGSVGSNPTDCEISFFQSAQFNFLELCCLTYFNLSFLHLFNLLRLTSSGLFGAIFFPLFSLFPLTPNTWALTAAEAGSFLVLDSTSSPSPASSVGRAWDS